MYLTFGFRISSDQTADTTDTDIGMDELPSSGPYGTAGDRYSSAQL